MIWLLAALIAIAFVEVLLRLPLMPALARLLATARQVHRVITSPRISDHWKEKTLVAYAGRLLRYSLLICGLLTFAFAVTALTGYILAQPFDAELLVFLIEVEGCIFATVVSLGYVFARSRFVRSRLVARQL